MKIQNNYLNNIFIPLKDENWLENQRIAGRCIANIMIILETLVKDKTNLSLIEIDKIVEDEILKRNCIPTFKNYKGFPNSICTSINKALVHGVSTNYKLQEGDVVSFDFGATKNGAIADSATTFIFGMPKSKNHINLISACRDALYAGIKTAKVGNRIGDIGYAVNKIATSKGFAVIDQYGGHGISYNRPHSDPFIPNKSQQNTGIRIKPGMTIAIEPMLVPANCSTNTKIAADNWTVYTEDIGAHEEHTIFIHEDRVEILTKRNNENRDI